MMKKYLLILVLALITAFSYAQDGVLSGTKAEVKAIYSGNSEWKLSEERSETEQELGRLTYIHNVEDVFKIIFFDDGLCVKTVSSFPKSDLSGLLKLYNTSEGYVKTTSNTWVSIEESIEAKIQMSKYGDRVDLIQIALK
jgi:hypothetical protein